MEWLRRIIDHPWTERTIMTLIIVNAVTLGLETNQAVRAVFVRRATHRSVAG